MRHRRHPEKILAPKHQQTVYIQASEEVPLAASYMGDTSKLDIPRGNTEIEPDEVYQKIYADFFNGMPSTRGGSTPTSLQEYWASKEQVRIERDALKEDCPTEEELALMKLGLHPESEAAQGYVLGLLGTDIAVLKIREDDE